MESDEILGDFWAGCASGHVGRVDEAVGRVGGVPGEADEDGECEEGVDVYDPV